jgi:hypothetical protein
MKNGILTLIIVSGLAITAHAQQTEQAQTFGLTLSGYVKADVFYDSRQEAKGREGEFELYPSAKGLDASGNDLNAIGDFNILSVQSRLTGKITAPDFLGAKSTGLFEGEFFGTSDADVNGFRLRLGYVNLNWNNSTQLLVGQAWHPLFITDAAPATVSYNTGTPFKTLSRNPQIKLTQAISSNVNVSLALISERDFQSTGPTSSTNATYATYLSDIGTPSSSTIFAQDAVIPNTDIQIAYRDDNFVLAATGDYKVLEPLQSTYINNGTIRGAYKTTEKLNSVIGQLTAKYKTADWSATVEGIYAQDPTSQYLIGGFAIKSLDTTNGSVSYTNFNTVSFWTDLVYGTQYQLGLFAGYTENLGASDNIATSKLYFYGRGNNIKDIYRISPRFALNFGKTRFAWELEYTAAAYGTNNASDKEKVVNTYTVSSVRALFGAYIFF